MHIALLAYFPSLKGERRLIWSLCCLYVSLLFNFWTRRSIFTEFCYEHYAIREYSNYI